MEIDKRTPRNRLARDRGRARRRGAGAAADRSRRRCSGPRTLFKKQDAHAGGIRADAARVRERGVASCEHAGGGSRMRASRSKTASVRAPITGTIIEKAVEARHRYHVADSGRVRRHRAHEDGRLEAPCKCARAWMKPTSARSCPACSTLRDRGRVSEPAVRRRGAQDRAAGHRRAERHVCSRGSLRFRTALALFKPGMNAEVRIKIANRAGVAAVPSGGAARGDRYPLTAQMLGVDAAALRTQIRPSRDRARAAAAGTR